MWVTSTHPSYAELHARSGQHFVAYGLPELSEAAIDWLALAGTRRAPVRRALESEGLQSIRGLRDSVERIVNARERAHFADRGDLAARASLRESDIVRLGKARVFESLGISRREGMWAARRTIALNATALEIRGRVEYGTVSSLSKPTRCALYVLLYRRSHVIFDDGHPKGK